MTVFSIASDVAGFVLPAVLAIRGVTVPERDPRMDAPLSEAERLNGITWQGRADRIL